MGAGRASLSPDSGDGGNLFQEGGTEPSETLQGDTRGLLRGNKGPYNFLSLIFFKPCLPS